VYLQPFVIKTCIHSLNQVYAFEPLSENIGRICQSIELNHFQDRITLFPFALSDKSEIVNMCYGMKGILSSAIPPACKGEKKELILTETFDTLAESIGLTFEDADEIVVALDVEGAEGRIISRASKLFSHPRLRYLLLELWKDWQVPSSDFSSPRDLLMWL